VGNRGNIRHRNKQTGVTEMNLEKLMTCIEDLHDATPHASHDWLANYIYTRQTHYTLAEIKTTIIATIG
jgi:hypothetical protein